MGILVENAPPLPGSDGSPHGPTKERREKKKQGERNGVGRRGAEYKSKAEERVRWLFIEMRKLALLRCGPAPETSPIKLQFTSKDHTVNEVRLRIY